tara:strand:+ start:2280 stop:2891 length:612 start_codon:yes stop_codon:yes gene_type:complete
MIQPNPSISFVQQSLNETVEAMKLLSTSSEYISSIIKASELIVKSIKNEGRVFLAGNGGSAADAQHFAAELVSRFMFDRNPLPAIALTTDTSSITAISNDYGYEKVFERQLLGLAKPGDIFIGITTSGKSQNIINALNVALSSDITTIAICGNNGVMSSRPHVLISVPSCSTPHIQEMHAVTSHLLCGLIETSIFSQTNISLK